MPKKKTSGSRDITDPDGLDKYLSQFTTLSTTEDEEILTALQKPASRIALWAWLIAGVLVLLVALMIMWMRR